MSTEVRPAHSPLGASGAERWMNCAGSVGLLQNLDLPETDEPDFAKEGTAAHEAAAKCALEGADAWERVGEQHNGIEVTPEMADAIQEFLDECNAHITPTSKVYTEFGIDAPEFHPQFYGTLDRGIVNDTVMVIRDFKYGAGVMVEVERNPQIMYYAYGLLRHHPEVTEVSIGIVQPRGFHPDGPIRVAPMMSADEIRNWAENELKPAMMRTAIDNDLDAGPWCRFCPAKLVCPLMVSLFGAAMTADPKQIIKHSDETADRDYKYLAAVKSYVKAYEADLLGRLKRGVVLRSCKLVPQKANRVYVPTIKVGDVDVPTTDVVKQRFGEDALTKVEVLSPAQLEKLSPEAKKFVHEYAYTPRTGETVAPMDDKRPAVKVQTTAEAFPGAAALAAEQE